MAEIQFGLMMRAQFPRGDDMPQRFAELVEQARLADRLGYASLTKGLHYSAEPWLRDRFVLGSPDEVADAILRLHRATGINHLIMSVQWPGMPQNFVLDELQMLAEEVFPRVRRG